MAHSSCVQSFLTGLEAADHVAPRARRQTVMSDHPPLLTSLSPLTLQNHSLEMAPHSRQGLATKMPSNIIPHRHAQKLHPQKILNCVKLTVIKKAYVGFKFWGDRAWWGRRGCRRLG